MGVARVVHCKRESFDVYIGRPSVWGNPFVIGKDGGRAEVVAKYAEWLRGQPDVLAGVPELRGKVLGCWCAPAACHGDVLASMANALNVGCPACAQQPGEWCAVWQEQVGMVAVAGLIHPERVEAALFRDGVSGGEGVDSDEATASLVRKVAAERLGL